MHRYLSILFVGALAVAGTLLLVWLFQRSLIYFPFGSVPTPVDVGLADAEIVTFPSTDGVTLTGWFLPAPESSARFTVLVFNGNAGHRGFRAPLASALGRLGLQVLLFDYRGYGGSAGTPTEAGLRADARAAHRYLTARDDVDASRLIYFGESLGTAVAVGLAAEQAPAGLILRSPFVSLVEVGRTHYPFLPVRLLLEDRFLASEDIQRVRCPLLVLAGDRDRVVPLPQSQQLYDAAPGPKEMVVLAGAGHNDLGLLAGDEMMRAIERFVDRITPRR